MLFNYILLRFILNYHCFRDLLLNFYNFSLFNIFYQFFNYGHCIDYFFRKYHIRSLYFWRDILYFIVYLFILNNRNNRFLFCAFNFGHHIRLFLPLDNSIFNFNILYSYFQLFFLLLFIFLFYLLNDISIFLSK